MKITPRVSALLLGCCVPLGAQVINVDFDRSDHVSLCQGLAAAPDDAGGSAVWNRVTRTTSSVASASGLLDSTGAATGVSVSLGINGSYLATPGQRKTAARASVSRR